jgi:hypothetical protein
VTRRVKAGDCVWPEIRRHASQASRVELEKRLRTSGGGSRLARTTASQESYCRISYWPPQRGSPRFTRVILKWRVAL